MFSLLIVSLQRCGGVLVPQVNLEQSQQDSSQGISSSLLNKKLMFPYYVHTVLVQPDFFSRLISENQLNLFEYKTNFTQF